jgi:hypothetical protein
MLNLDVMRIRILPSQIYFLKFIVEGYDGLAVISTVSVETGDLIIRCPSPCQSDVQHLLISLADRLGYERAKS